MLYLVAVSVLAAITKYHRSVAETAGIYFLTVLEARSPRSSRRSRCQQGWCLVRAGPYGCVITGGERHLQYFPSYKDTSSIRLGSTFMSKFNFLTSSQLPSPNIVVFQVKTSIYKFGEEGDHRHSVHNSFVSLF